jgi:acetolactate synthase-1/2/3 large subunit
MKASDYIARFLEREGVPCVFEMSGGMITHLLDSLHRVTKVKIVSVHHEQAAAFAADAMGRMTGIPGVAMATSGPGATNLLTGIGSCYFDSSPGVFVTGQVNRYELRGERAIRQLGFQETDIVSMARPITKAAWQVAEPEHLSADLRRAFQIARSGRPGPVLLDIPMDVQRADVEDDGATSDTEARSELVVDPQVVHELVDAIGRAKRPLILAGAGVRAGRAIEGFRSLVHHTGIPVVTSLLGVDVLPFDDPLRVGMIGSYGNRWANLAIGVCDLLIVVGSRLDIRQTGSDTAAFRGDRVIYHVDCEAGEINNRVPDCHPVVAELRSFFEAAVPVAARSPRRDFPEWLAEIDSLRRQWPDTKELDVAGINPNAFMHDLSRTSAGAAAYVVDVGQHQMWAAQSLDIRAAQRFLTSGGMGSMGFALPAAIGTAFAAPGLPVVTIAGDGGFQANVQELQTIVRNRLPIKIVIVNNRCHGMVRQFQESYFDGRYQSTYWGYSAPDFSRVAEAYGMPAMTITRAEESAAAAEWLWRQPSEPALLQVMVDTFANAYPKIAFGRPNTEMEPLATPIAMEST